MAQTESPVRRVAGVTYAGKTGFDDWKRWSIRGERCAHRSVCSAFEDVIQAEFMVDAAL